MLSQVTGAGVWSGPAAGGVAAHAFGGALHTPDTFANLNTRLTDGPVVKLAGQLGGAAATPDVRGIRETGGPTLLGIGAIADGDLLKRSGANVIGTSIGATGGANSYAQGCAVSWASVSTVQIATGVLRSDDDTQDIVVSGVLTADITTTGANGRNVDTAETASKWYAVCVIKNVSTGTVAAFLINEDDLGGFTWPAGYSVKRRVGWIRNNGSSNFVKGRTIGQGSWRLWEYDAEKTALEVLTSGSATSFTDVDFSDFVPPTCRLVLTNSDFDPSGTEFCYFREDGSTVTSPPTFVKEAAAPSSAEMILPLSSSQILEYRNTDSGNDMWLYVMGWYDEV